MAIKTQGAAFYAESARAAAKTITAITAATPPVVTSTAHGYSNGDIVFIDGVVGMVEVNGRVFQVANKADDTFELEGIVGLNIYTAYASGGSAYKLTMTEVGEISAISGFDGSAPEINTTNLRSTAAEYLIGLQDFGSMNLTLNLDNTDTGQTLMRTIKAAATVKGFQITDSAGYITTFPALVQSFSISLQANDAVRAAIAMKVAAEPAWFV